MNLRDHMEDAVGNTSADLGRLSQDSRRVGTKRRRYRQVLGGVSVAAATAVAFSAVHAATGDSGAGRGPVAGDISAAATTTPSAEPSASPDAGVVPLTGRSTVAALRASIDEQSQGAYGGFAGQGGVAEQQSRDTYGEVEFTPSDGTGVGVVRVNVQDGSILDGSAFNCAQAWMVDCQVRTLANGDRLRTYQEEPVRTAEGDGLRLTAELLTNDRSLRVVASATNGFELPSNQWDVTRPQPVLTTTQLSEIVSQALWSFQIPRAYASEGQELSPYTDLDAQGGWIHGDAGTTRSPKA